MKYYGLFKPVSCTLENNPSCLLNYIDHCLSHSEFKYIVRGEICQVYPPKMFFSSILLKLHQIVVLVDLFEFYKGSASTITGCQNTGA